MQNETPNKHMPKLITKPQADLRNQVAMHALQGLLSNSQIRNLDATGYIRKAFEYADMFMEKR